MRSSRSSVRRLAAASLVSLAGSDAAGVALSFALYLRTGSGVWLAAGLLVSLGLSSVLGPLGGVLADRHDRRALMLAGDLVAGVCFAVLVVVDAPAVMLGLTAVATAAGCLAAPAAAAALPVIAGDRDLEWANGVLAIGANVGKTAGRLGAGVLVAACGAPMVFGVNALSFLASAGLVLSVRGPFQAARPVARASGPALPWRQIAAHPTFRLVTASGCVATFMTAFTMVAELPLVVLHGAGAVGLGALAASWSLGMIAGSWWAGRTLTPANAAQALAGGRVLMGLGIGAVAFSPIFWPTLACYLVGGAAGGFLLVAASSLLQRAAADELRGRTLALADAAKTAAFGVGTVLAGLLVQPIGPQTVYAVVGLGVVVSALPAWRLSRAAAVPRALALAR